MPIFASNLVPSTTDRALGGSVIERSLRFNDDDSAYLSRTPSSAGNRKTWTWSAWIKRGTLGSRQILFSADDNVTYATYFMLEIQSDDNLRALAGTEAAAGTLTKETAAVIRDTTSWYHLVFKFDAANTSAVWYINGEEITDLNASSNPANQDFQVNATSQHFLGRFGSSLGTSYFDGYMAEVNFVDGQALDASYFGYTESQTGLWRPKRYEGTYGTNGFHLDFSDNSSTSTLGIDKSPNGNDFTTNNFSVTAGEGNDSVLDTPTKNWDILNPLDPTSKTLSDGNLKCLGSTGFMAGSNFAVTSGKWYMEVKYISGTSNHQWSAGFSSPDRSYLRLVRGGDGELTPNTGNVAVTFADPDILMLALDVDNGKWYIGKNGSYMLSGDPVNGTGFVHSGLSSSEGFVFCAINNTGDGSQTITANFGQQGFTYTPPTGFKAFNSSNLPPNVPSIIKPQKHFETLLYTGTGSSNSVTGLEFAPDFIWARRRSSPDGHHFLLIDTVRGGSKSLQSNTNDSENSNANRDMTFLKDGIRWNSNTGNANASGESYVVWCWKGGGAAVSNTNGDITSSVSVNEEAGFSIVSYSGNGGNGQTVGHGLSKAPQWIMLKSRTASSNWRVWSHALATDGSKRLILDSDNSSENAGFLNDTAPSSTVFTLGNSDDAWNVNSGTYIAYCWHEVPGYSKFGKYDPNQSDNGPFVNLGFKPAWIMVKSMGQIFSGVNGNWYIIDSSRDALNPTSRTLAPNQNYDEDTGWPASGLLDILSNGFKVKTSSLAINSTTSSSFAYFAFAEQPGTTPFETFPNPR